MSNHVMHSALKVKSLSNGGLPMAFLNSDTRDFITNNNSWNGHNFMGSFPCLTKLAPYVPSKPYDYTVGYGGMSTTNIPNFDGDFSRIRLASHTQFQDSTLRVADLSNAKDGYANLTLKTSLAMHMFDNCKFLSSVTLPSTLITINGCAFKNCVSLSSIEIPPTLTNLYSDSFNGAGLSSISIPSSVTATENYALANMPNLLHADAYFTFIPQRCFYNDQKLTDIDLHNAKINTIGQWGFDSCKALTSIIMDYSSVINIERAGFGTCSSLTDLSFPSAVSVGDSAFAQCLSLSSLSLPSLVITGSKAFSETALSSFEYPSSVVRIGGKQFANTATIKNIKLNSVPEELSYEAFLNPKSEPGLTITLPWSEGEVLGYPWGADVNETTFVYLGTSHPEKADEIEPPTENLIVHMPLTEDFTETVSNRPVARLNSLQPSPTVYKDLPCMDFNKKNGGIQITAANMSDIKARMVNHDISMSIWTCPMYTDQSWSTYIRLGPKTNAKCLQLAATYSGSIIAGSSGSDIYGPTATSGEWFHVVITYNEATHALTHWVNGIKYQTTVDINLDLESTNGLIMGQINNNSYHRYMYDFRIYDCELSQENVMWLYNNPLPKEHPQSDEIVYYAPEQVELYDSFTVDTHTFSDGMRNCESVL